MNQHQQYAQQRYGGGGGQPYGQQQQQQQQARGYGQQAQYPPHNAYQPRGCPPITQQPQQSQPPPRAYGLRPQQQSYPARQGYGVPQHGYNTPPPLPQQGYGGYGQPHQQHHPHDPRVHGYEPHARQTGEAQRHHIPRGHAYGAATPQEAQRYAYGQPPAASSYATQAAKWKQGFASTEKERHGTDRELSFIKDLCSSEGTSSFPPRDTLNKLLRALHSLDHQYICDLLHNKLNDQVWQVKARALSVLDALLQTECVAEYIKYYLPSTDMFEDLIEHPKRPVSTRAAKIHQTLQEAAIAATVDTTATANTAAASTGSFLDFSNPSDQSECHADVQRSPTAVESPKGSALSFINSSAPAALGSFEPRTTTTAVMMSNEPTDDSVLAFSATPTVSLDAVDHVRSLTDHVVRRDKQEDDQPVSPSATDRIHNAFAGLDFDTPVPVLPDAVTMSSSSFVPAAEPVSKVAIEIELPPGALGIVLDTRIQEMAVIEKFVLLPNGRTGLLALHPSLCPGCYLVRINGKDVSSWSLAQIGEELGRTSNMERTLLFHKQVVRGMIVDPSDPTKRYAPAPRVLEEEEGAGAGAGAGEIVVDEPFVQHDEAAVDTQGSSSSKTPDRLMEQLASCEAELAGIESQVDRAASVINDRLSAQADRAAAKSALSQLHGAVGKLERERIDAIILGPAVAADEASSMTAVKQWRSGLILRSERMIARIHSLVKQQREHEEEEREESMMDAHTNGTEVPTETSSSSVFAFVEGPSSPQSSAFDFVAPNGVAAPEDPTSPQGSGFAFM